MSICCEVIELNVLCDRCVLLVLAGIPWPAHLSEQAPDVSAVHRAEDVFSDNNKKRFPMRPLMTRTGKRFLMKLFMAYRIAASYMQCVLRSLPEKSAH